jgi:two-component system, NarL family, response regulator NreC
MPFRSTLFNCEQMCSRKGRSVGLGQENPEMANHPRAAGRDAAITIVLADDHAVVRQGLRALLESDPRFVVVGEAANGFEAVEMVKRHKPAVLIADLIMPGKNGLATASALSRMKSQTRVIILSVYGDRAYVLEALKNGAAGYVVKESCGAELIQAIRVAVAGGRYVSPTTSEACTDALSADGEILHAADARGMEKSEKLTAREQMVLQQVAEGTSVQASAIRLGISSRKVEGHRADLLHKLRLSSQEALIRYAVRRGVVPDARRRGPRKSLPRPASKRRAGRTVRSTAG